MRRILASLGAATFLTGLVFLAMGVASTPERHANGTVYVTPTSPTPSPVPSPSVARNLPACVEEDGSSQALCWWDAQEQGNGLGTSVVSGDCAPDIMGQDSALCVQVHARKSVVVENGDGSSHTIPNGADIVGECVSIENEAYGDKAVRAALNSEGWTMRECLMAW